MLSSENDLLKNEAPLREKLDKAASDEAQKQFWKALRHFYRTGEKQGESEVKGLSSIFKRSIEAIPSPYPTKIDKKEIQYSPDTAYQIIGSYISQYQVDRIGGFKRKLHALIVSLGTQLNIKTNASKKSEGFDFAEELIAFDKLSKLVPKHDGDQLTENRKNRLEEVLSLLKEGLHTYQMGSAIWITSKKEEGASEVFYHVEKHEIRHQNAIAQATDILRGYLTAYTLLIKAFRIASLEMDEAYDASIHDDFFSHFTWYRLSDDEKALFRPVFLEVDHSEVMHQMDDLSRLLSTNWPVKLFITNHQLMTAPRENVSWEEAAHSYRQELYAFVTAHRHVSLFQLSIANPDELKLATKQWIEEQNPSLMHLLMPMDQTSFLNTRAASYSRFYPSIRYHPANKKSETPQWQINNNPQPEKKWTEMDFEMIDDAGVSSRSVGFTYADYKAFFDSKRNELMLVPSTHNSDYLVTLSSYLELPQEELVGKVPFIWLEDDDHQLYKAAIPNVWVVSCQERLDNWYYLQEKASPCVSVIPASEESKDASINEADLEQVREEATQMAARRLVQALLDE